MIGLISSALNYGAGSGGATPINLGCGGYTPPRLNKMAEYFDRKIIDKIVTSDKRFNIELVKYDLKSDIVEAFKNFKFNSVYNIFSYLAYYSAYTSEYSPTRSIIQKYITPFYTSFMNYMDLVVEAVHNDSGTTMVILRCGSSSFEVNMAIINTKDVVNNRRYANYLPQSIRQHFIEIPKNVNVVLNLNTDYLTDNLPIIQVDVKDGALKWIDKYYSIEYTVTDTNLSGNFIENQYDSSEIYSKQFRYIPFNPNSVDYSKPWEYTDINLSVPGYFLNAFWKSVFKTVGIMDKKLFMEW